MQNILYSIYLYHIDRIYTLDRFQVQEPYRVLRLYWVSFLNGKISLSNPLMILSFDNVSSK